MKKFITFSLLAIFISCSVKDEKEDNTTPPTPPIEHTGTIKGSLLTIHGQYIDGVMASLYARLPKRLEDSPDRDLVGIKRIGLHTDSAGLYIAFETDATSIEFDFKLKSGANSLEANDDTEFGFDLYSLENEEWKSIHPFHLANYAEPFEVNSTYNNTSGKMKKYILLFPLFSGLANTIEDDFEITIPEDAEFHDRAFFGEDTKKPILIYGTSITQGTSPSRVGLAYTSRLLFLQKREILNMGFAGQGRMFTDIADYMATIPSAIFFIDPTMNMAVLNNKETTKNNAKYMINTYRAAHPNTPIVAVSQFDGNLTSANDDTEGFWGTIMKEVFDELTEDGVENFYFIPRGDFIPKGSIRDSGVIDNTHPGDEGMKGYADKYEEWLNIIPFDE